MLQLTIKQMCLTSQAERPTVYLPVQIHSCKYKAVMPLSWTEDQQAVYLLHSLYCIILRPAGLQKPHLQIRKNPVQLDFSLILVSSIVPSQQRKSLIVQRKDTSGRYAHSSTLVDTTQLLRLFSVRTYE